MAVKITIVGMGQIGTSIGLALANQSELLQRVGHDRELNTARQAEKMGALDKVAVNLPSAVRDADIVVLSLPMDEIRPTLALIAPELKEDVVVMDTAPVKEVVATWAGELLPPKRHYVGLTPVLNPAYLLEPSSGVEAAQADLFRQGLIAIVAPPRTTSEAIKLAADLTRLLGSTPLFVDPMEIDGLMAATHLLPQIIAAGLLNATVDQPGWREGRKVAGRGFAEATAPITHLSEPSTLQASVMFNRENVLRVLDGLIASLQTLRNDIEAKEDQSLLERLARARRGRERWWQQRQAGEWVNTDDAYPAGSEDVSSSDIFSRLFGGLGKRRKSED